MPIKNKTLRKEYYKAKNQTMIGVWLNSEEKSVLNSMMKEEGWENKSGFIKYILFGDDPEMRYDKIVKKKDPNEILMICATQLRELNIFLKNIQFQYEKDMNQIYQEESVNIKKWIKSTNDPHVKTIQRINDTYDVFRKIAKCIGVEIDTQIEEESK